MLPSWLVPRVHSAHCTNRQEKTNTGHNENRTCPLEIKMCTVCGFRRTYPTRTAGVVVVVHINRKQGESCWNNEAVDVFGERLQRGWLVRFQLEEVFQSPGLRTQKPTAWMRAYAVGLKRRNHDANTPLPPLPALDGLKQKDNGCYQWTPGETKTKTKCTHKINKLTNWQTDK